jgi:protein gp37
VSDKSAIEWTDATWNPVTGCTKVSPACANCYIERQTPLRIAGRKFVKGHIPLEFHEHRLDAPLRRRTPTVYFVNSMSDLFHEDVPDAFIDKLFAVMALAWKHTFQVLTKRPERMRDYVLGVRHSASRGEDTAAWAAETLPIKSLEPIARMWDRPLWNVWLGVSVENQHFADERIPLLLQTPAAVRFISAEPLLEAIDLRRYLGGNQEDSEQGGRGLSSGARGRVEDRFGRPDLASHGQTREPLDRRDACDPLRAKEGGKAIRGLSSGPCDVELEAGSRAGASARVATFQRADPSWLDGESQERSEDGERADESRASDGLRADPARHEAPRVQPNAEPPQRLSWVIVGGESGPRLRPTDPAWVRAIRDQCVAAGVPFFFKQWGGRTPKSGGRELDGRTWDEMPMRHDEDQRNTR